MYVLNGLMLVLPNLSYAVSWASTQRPSTNGTKFVGMDAAQFDCNHHRPNMTGGFILKPPLVMAT